MLVILLTTFCQNNCYALDIQNFFDRQRRILWLSSGHQGASHDMIVCYHTEIQELLDILHGTLKKHGLFLVGDSAYPLLPTSLHRTPNPDRIHKKVPSNSGYQITQIECTFGKFIGRFDLFWRILRFKSVQHSPLSFLPTWPLWSRSVQRGCHGLLDDGM